MTSAFHPQFNRFLRNILYFSAIIAVICLLVSLILPPGSVSPALPFLLIFFLAVTVTSFKLVVNTLDKKFSRFVNRFMAMTGLKLLLYIAVIIAYVLINKADALPFLASFFLLYICYTVFEVTAILSLTKPARKQ